MIDDEGVVVTESGAILLYLARKSGKLMPRDLAGEAQVLRWCVAALNTIEVPVLTAWFVDLNDGKGTKASDALHQWFSKRARRRARRKAAEGEALYAMSQVAARSDGAILVSTADLTDRDLTGREVERYVTLTEAEASVLRGRLTNALGEAASCFAVTLPKRRQP